MKIRKIIIGLIAVTLFSGCDDLFEPALENYRDKDAMYDEANYALGILLNGYTRIPVNGWSFSDVATDDAVSNDRDNGYRKLATGSWTSNSNAVDQWTNGLAAIQYMNMMLEESDKVKWSEDENLRRMFNDRTKGEAYALRGLFMYYLLQAHAGRTADGTLVGVPILEKSLDTNSAFNLPRATFEECMQQLYTDLAKAEELLPLDFEDISSDAQIPEKYAGINKEEYNRVFGAYSRLRITARIAKGVRAQAALMAASPAYEDDSNTTTWEKAAGYAADVLDLIGGINGIDDNGWTWYCTFTEIDGLKEGGNPKEILWRGGISDNRDLETDNYPPSQGGRGRINPTQNLVDAFPMENGYPIGRTEGGYNSNKPYEKRDSRLKKYIVVDGTTVGPNTDEVINTFGFSMYDAINQSDYATRTGYYLRKLLREDVNLDALTANTQRHYKPYIRYTEIYLAFAEAANEAWGPKDSRRGYSAYDVIKKIRERAGICRGTADPYLDECAADPVKMRELIRNERRLELCFEGFRFWDLRRWKVDMNKLNETARGLNQLDGSFVDLEVENRIYKEHMYYGPIPYNEVLKWDALEQNVGW